MNENVTRLLDYLQSICYSNKHFTVGISADGGLDVIIDSFKFHDFDLADDGTMQFSSIENDTNFSMNLNQIRDYHLEDDGSFAVACENYRISCDVI